MLELKNKFLNVRVSKKGGSIVDAYDYKGRAFLRPYSGESENFDIIKTASFPMLPLCNRVADNEFKCAGTKYQLSTNSIEDPLYLHGDGWLAEWEVIRQKQDLITLTYKHSASHNSPYNYLAKQIISLEENKLTIFLEVKNSGDRALPFGIGFHPFFPRTEKSTLHAKAKTWWTCDANSLPLDCESIPSEFDFTKSHSIPDKSIDNAYEGWVGMASISWPENGLAVDIIADPIFSRFMIYAPTETKEFFCFEPMSHIPNGINHSDLGGMTILDPGQSLSGSISLQVRDL